MANKRDANRQRRTNQNRAQRAALAARTSGEAVKRPSRVAPSTAEKLANAPKAAERADGDAEATTKGAGSAKGGRAGKAGAKPRRERAPRPGDRPVDIDTLEGNFFSKVTKVPGGMQVLMTLALTILVCVLMTTMKSFKPDGQETNKDIKPTLTMIDKFGLGKTVAVLAVPLVIVLIAVACSLLKSRRRIWIGCAMGLAAIGLYLFPFVFPMAFLIYAVMRSSRIEGPNKPLVSSFLDKRKANAAAIKGESDAAGPDADDS